MQLLLQTGPLHAQDSFLSLLLVVVPLVGIGHTFLLL